MCTCQLGHTRASDGAALGGTARDGNKTTTIRSSCTMDRTPGSVNINFSTHNPLSTEQRQNFVVVPGMCSRTTPLRPRPRPVPLEAKVKTKAKALWGQSFRGHACESLGSQSLTQCNHFTYCISATTRLSLPVTASVRRTSRQFFNHISTFHCNRFKASQGAVTTKILWMSRPGDWDPQGIDV